MHHFTSSLPRARDEAGEGHSILLQRIHDEVIGSTHDSTWSRCFDFNILNREEMKGSADTENNGISYLGDETAKNAEELLKDSRVVYQHVGNRSSKKIYLIEKKVAGKIAKKGLVMFSSDHYTKGSGACAYDLMSTIADSSVFDDIVEVLKKDVAEPREAKEDGFYLMVKTKHGLTSRKFKVSDAKVNLAHYNDDVVVFHDQLIDTLQNTNKGLYLFHGKPGTGKTSFLRHLVNRVKKKIIFIPPDMTSILSSPDIIPFLQENSESILIIEDAENVLIKRDANSSQGVSTILNITDGLMGDALSISIICTFNTGLDDLDEALLRPGRLIFEHNFGELTEDKTLAVFQSVHGKNPTSKRMTLAEIYDTEKIITKTKKQERSFGFTK